MKFTMEQIVKAVGGRVAVRGAEAFGGVSTDSRKIGNGELFIPLRGENFDGHEFIGAALERGAAGFLFEASGVTKQIVDKLAKSNAAAAFEVKDTLYALGELARAARMRYEQLPLVAITGSAGKSTSKEMAASIVSLESKVLKNEGNLNNRVGLPITLFKLTDEIEAVVVELGTNEPGEIARLAEISKPNVGLVTNVGPVHLEGLGSVEGVAKEKGALPEALGIDDTFVANCDDPHVMDMIGRSKAKIIGYSIEKDKSGEIASMFPKSNIVEFITANKVERIENVSRFVIRTGEGEAQAQIPALGIHNVANALGAAGVARALGQGNRAIVEGLGRFKPLPMRAQIHLLAADVTVIEDCYNSNPLSVAAALELLAPKGNKSIAVLGEMRELGEQSAGLHEHLGVLAALKDVDVLIALGEHAENIVRGFVKQTKTGKALAAFGVEDAANKAIAILERGDKLLLKASRAVKLEGALPIIMEKWNSMNSYKSNNTGEGRR